jgi:exosortase/archaeosortase family protein
VLALCTIFAFMNFRKMRNRIIMIAAGFPLAIIGNITRLLGIIVVSDAFGREYGQMVHDNTWFSLLPYVPPIIGILVLGHFLREKRPSDETEGQPPDAPPSQGRLRTEQKSPGTVENSMLQSGTQPATS